MRVAKILPPLILCLASSLATAQEKNCSDLTNPQARQECMVKGQRTNLNDPKMTPSGGGCQRELQDISGR
jgi:hypothetical protein